MDAMEKAERFGADVLNVTTTAIRDDDGSTLTAMVDRLDVDQARLVIIAASVHLCAAVDTINELARRLGEEPDDYKPGGYL